MALNESRKTYQAADRPHLVSKGVAAVEQLAGEGVRVHPSEVALLLILCDKVDAAHGQWYGSLSNLADRLPWERHWFSKWLQRLAAHGLVEKLGILEGRKLDTWQILPNLYPPLVEPITATSLEEAVASTSGHGSDHYHALVEPPGTPLVEPLIADLVASLGTTNNETPSEQRSEHRGFTKPRRRTNTHEALGAEAIEAERKRQLEALRSLSA